MRYTILACDYDGTLAHHGKVDEPTMTSLERLSASGRRVLLVTGRELDELLSIFPQASLFTYIVAENGALLFRPETKEEVVLGTPPPQQFLQRLRKRGVSPLSAGRVIVATWRPHETAMFEVIRDLGMEWQIIFNKNAVMALPSGVNKASGLAAVVTKLGCTADQVVGVGDAENDQAFLEWCEVSVAVANALPQVKEKVDWVTRGERGAGVVELIERLIVMDLSELDGQTRRAIARRREQPHVRHE